MLSSIIIRTSLAEEIITSLPPAPSKIKFVPSLVICPSSNTKLPVVFILPATCNSSLGEVVPIPTLPA